jgi:3-hydroxyethyl bacteriochlorophyllide a dehydrogenase
VSKSIDTCRRHAKINIGQSVAVALLFDPDRRGKPLQTRAVLLSAPGQLGLDQVGIIPPAADDIVVKIAHSGISTGTEKLFWTGEMPPFPGMGYPLIPGYEAAGEVVEAGADSGYRVGEHVFVPGASCYEGAHGLFGAAAETIVTKAARVTRIDRGLGAAGALLALAATARHSMAGPNKAVPDLIIGHGVLGRLLARLTIASGAPAPTVWEIDPARMDGADGYAVMQPENDIRRNYKSVYDASGRGDLLNDWIGRIVKGGEIVLAGFYSAPLQFAFPPAFMKEARFRISAEWTPDDMTATKALVEAGVLELADLITHQQPAELANGAYQTAFTDPACLKMILNWGTS